MGRAVDATQKHVDAANNYVHHYYYCYYYGYDVRTTQTYRVVRSTASHPSPYLHQLFGYICILIIIICLICLSITLDMAAVKLFSPALGASAGVTGQVAAWQLPCRT